MRLNKIKLAALGVATLAFAALPTVGVFADSTTNVTINAEVDSAITVSASTPVNITAEVDTLSTGNTTVNVKTNNSSGYTLSIKDSDEETTLKHSTNTIAAVTGGTISVPVALTAGTWGYRLNGWTAERFVGVTTSNVQLVEETSATPSAGNNLVVTFGVLVNASQPQGTYTGGVTFTAAARA